MAAFPCLKSKIGEGETLSLLSGLVQVPLKSLNIIKVAFSFTNRLRLGQAKGGLGF
jgi:hypothetical protein